MMPQRATGTIHPLQLHVSIVKTEQQRYFKMTVISV
jgi:hypothetical protein